MNYYVKDLPIQKLVLVNLDDQVQKALNVVRTLKEKQNIDIKKIALKDDTGTFRFISYWALRLLDSNITFKQAYDNNNNLFKVVKLVSSNEKIENIVTDLYEYSGLIITERENIIGFVSFDYFSESDLESFIKPSLLIREIQQKSRIKEGLVGIDLNSSDLEGIDLRDLDLRSSNLSKANLNKANLRNANLTGANLSYSSFKDAKLARAKLNRADLNHAKLINTDLRLAQLWGANLEEAELIGANLNDAVLFKANLKSANLKDANLNNSGLMDAILEGADLSNASLENTDFRHSIFDENTNLKKATINSTTIDNLSGSALKANWDPEIKQIILNKFLANSFFLKTTSFLREDKQEEFQKKTEINKKLYDIRAIVDSNIESALEKVDHVEYQLSTTYPEDHQVQIKKNYADKFQLKELAWGGYPLTANVFLEGKKEPIKLQKFIKLEKSGSKLL